MSAQKCVSATRSGMAIAVLLLAGLWADHAQARAYCSLRDPVTAINQLFPGTDGFLSTVRVVDGNARNRVAEALPFTIHYNELGKHTLYTALNQTQPVGFVHVRSEPGPWGLMEVAWALTPQLTIRDLSFQRCRAAQCNEPMRAELAQLLHGKSWSELGGLISADGGGLNSELSGRYGDYAGFVLAIVKSGMKTALVSEISWPEEIARVLAMDMSASTTMPGNEQDPISVNPLPVSAQALERLQSQDGGMANATPGNVSVYGVQRGDRKDGWLIADQWAWGGQAGHAYWMMSPNGTVQGITAVPPFPTEEMQQAFQSLKGRSVSARENCETAAEILAYELYQIALSAGP